jgi:hypothetical protein
MNKPPTLNTVQEVIDYLKTLPPDMPIGVEYSYFNCTGHGPDEYCYCAYETKHSTINSITVNKYDEYGRKLRSPRIVINT